MNWNGTGPPGTMDLDWNGDGSPLTLATAMPTTCFGPKEVLAAAAACLAAGCAKTSAPVAPGSNGSPHPGYASPRMHEPVRLGHLSAETAYVLPAMEWVLGDVEYFRVFNDRKKYSTIGRFEFGITNRLLLDAEVSYETVYWDSGGETDGLGDIRTGAKYQVFKSNALALAVRTSVFYPTGRPIRDTGKGIFVADLGMAASARLGREKWALHAAAGGRLRESSGLDSGFATLAVEFRTPLAPDEMYLQLGLSAVYGEGDTPVQITPGIHVAFDELPWQVPIEFQVSFGVPVGLSSDAPDWGIRLQLDAYF